MAAVKREEEQPDYDEVQDIDYADEGQPDFDEGPQVGYDEDAQPDAEEASQEWQLRSQK